MKIYRPWTCKGAMIGPSFGVGLRPVKAGQSYSQPPA